MDTPLKTDRSGTVTVSQNPEPRRIQWRYLVVLTLLLLILFASRAVRIYSLELDPDEVWSVWQTLGSPAEIVKWTPYDWSPLYYLIVGGWKELTGIHPFTLRLLPLFTFMIAMAILYRVTQRLYGATAGVIAVAACSALGYAIHLSLSVRAYGLVFCCAILAWWLVLRYFNRPNVKRGLLLGVCLSVLFYLHVSSVGVFVLLGLYTLVVYGRRVWQWWLPVLTLIVLGLPEIISKVGAATTRAASNSSTMEQWLAGGASIVWQIMRDLVTDFAGHNFGLWAAFMAIAALIIIERYRFNWRSLGLAVWVLSPLFLFVMGVVDAYTTRHTTWLMLGFAMWIGAGFQFLPRAAILGVLAVFVVVMFGAVPIDRYKRILAPMVPTFNWLSDRVQAGDSVLVDPNYKAVAPEEWDYYTKAYFPNGLQYVAEPGQGRRVWYLYADGQQNQELFRQVQQNRTVTAQLESPQLMVQLYEAPPDAEGVAFDNGMRFHGVETLNSTSPVPVWHEGETMRIRLWWSTEKQIDVDLSVGTYVVGESGTVAEFNGPPQIINGPKETSQWQPGRYYIEEREIALAYPMKMATYPLLLSVYQWWDSKRIAAAGHDDGLIPIMNFFVMSWSSRH